MVGHKRGHQNGASGSSRGATSSATVYRKSAKKQRTDQEEAKTTPSKKLVPQRTRPKHDPKPKTKHEFIQAKKAAAQKEKATAAAARRAEQEQEKSVRKLQKGKAAQRASTHPSAILIKAPVPTRSFKIVAGSYERLLYGLQATVEPSTASSSTKTNPFHVTLKPIFTFPAHISSIRTVATAGADSKWLATGGTDEVVKVWDLRKQREVGQLTGHEGTITSLVFASRTYLLTTSADSHINLYRTRDWALLRTLKGHIGRINSAAPHPTGRLALSVGSDRTIRMWDLMRGQAAASTRIGIEADLVRWNTSGSRFVVLAYRQAMIFRTDMTKVAELEEKKRIGDVCFFQVKDGSEKQRELFLAGLEDGIVKIFDMDAQIVGKEQGRPNRTRAKAGENEEQDDEEDEDEDLHPLVEVGRLVGHKNRVRSVSVLPVMLPSGKKDVEDAERAQSSYVAITISSDGFVRVFDLSAIVQNLPSQARTLEEFSSSIVEVESLAEYDTKGTRLTCLTTVGIAEPGANTADEEDPDDDDVIGSDDESEALGDVEDEDEEDEGIDTDAEDEELKALEKAIKEAQAKGLDLEDLEALLDGQIDDEISQDGQNDDGDDDDEEEEGGEGDSDRSSGVQGANRELQVESEEEEEEEEEEETE